MNRNEGAESTLMWLMASEHIRAIRAVPPDVRPAAGAGLAPVGGVATTTAAPR